MMKNETFSSLAVGNMTLDRDARAVVIDGNEVQLSKLEYNLLLHFMTEPNKLQTREQLLVNVWGAQPDMKTRTVDMHIARLRAKIANDSTEIRSVRGMGYRFITSAK